MSYTPISHSPDLKRLRDEGYDIEVKSGHLLVKDVPYVNSNKEVKRGILVSVLTLAGDVTARPDNHVIYFIGEHPCNQDGSEINQIKNSSCRTTLGENIIVDHTFSAKPICGYHEDYYDKVTNYIAILSGRAQAIDPSVTAKTFPVVIPVEEESVFNYIDTASSRAAINIVTQKLKLEKVAIVGLGGTGSYVLDLVAKTPVKEIHLFDGDTFLQHNAFRSPGAPSIDELKTKPRKVTYLKNLYSKMRQGIIIHETPVNEENVEQLRGMNFIFLCIEGTKKLIIEKLEEFAIPFIDVGMGVYMVDNSLAGILRITSSTPTKHDHLRNRISFSDGDDGNNEYAHNIQIADLNALNAALAVIKWKKLFGFYVDLDHEHHSTYTIDGNALANEDKV
ncbi:MAG: ThiF family adenylyltransferase [Smithella sp.]